MTKKELNEKKRELKDMIEGMLDDCGLREEYEKFKERRKPDFKIIMKSNPNGKSCMLELEGNRPSLLFALAHLTAALIDNTNLTAEDIREAVEEGIDAAEEHDEDEDEDE